MVAVAAEDGIVKFNNIPSFWRDELSIAGVPSLALTCNLTRVGAVQAVTPPGTAAPLAGCNEVARPGSDKASGHHERPGDHRLAAAATALP